MEVELMVTKRDDRQPTDRVNIEQSASGRLEGRVLQYVITKESALKWKLCHLILFQHKMMKSAVRFDPWYMQNLQYLGP